MMSSVSYSKSNLCDSSVTPRTNRVTTDNTYCEYVLSSFDTPSIQDDANSNDWVLHAIKHMDDNTLGAIASTEVQPPQMFLKDQSTRHY